MLLLFVATSIHAFIISNEIIMIFCYDSNFIGFGTQFYIQPNSISSAQNHWTINYYVGFFGDVTEIGVENSFHGNLPM